ncbi:MAG: acetamidase/formamidase family protein [Acidimicrobiales bacterium]
MRRIGRDLTSFYFDPAREPVLSVEIGERFVVETEDAHCGSITHEGIVYANLREARAALGGANPVTGPVALDGLRAGDCLRVHICDVSGAPVRGFGHMNTTQTLHEELSPKTTICHRDGDHVVLPTARGPIRVPYTPMIGTLGVAPADGPIEAFMQRPDILGNVDLPDLRAGAEVVLRANVDGGLLSMGDAHIAQGDAEIHRSAVESQADVTLWLDRGRPEDVGFVELPQINSTTHLGSVAPGPGHLEDLVRSAYDDLAERLRHFHQLTLGDAYRLLGAAGEVQIGQVVPPVYSALARIDRRYVEESS